MIRKFLMILLLLVLSVPVMAQDSPPLENPPAPAAPAPEAYAGPLYFIVGVSYPALSGAQNYSDYTTGRGGVIELVSARGNGFYGSYQVTQGIKQVLLDGIYKLSGTGISFPFGFTFMELPGDSQRARAGYNAGALIDFWADRHLGLGFGLHYSKLVTSELPEDAFVSGEAALKIRF